jgi:hypothetical protein
MPERTVLDAQKSKANQIAYGFTGAYLYLIPQEQYCSCCCAAIVSLYQLITYLGSRGAYYIHQI